MGLIIKEVNTTISTKGVVYFGDWKWPIDKAYIISCMAKRTDDEIWIDKNIDSGSSSDISCQIRKNSSGNTEIRIDSSEELVTTPLCIRIIIGFITKE